MKALPAPLHSKHQTPNIPRRGIGARRGYEGLARVLTGKAVTHEIREKGSGPIRDTANRVHAEIARCS